MIDNVDKGLRCFSTAVPELSPRMRRRAGEEKDTKERGGRKKESV